MSDDLFARMKAADKKERQELADAAVVELMNLDWMKLRVKPDSIEKTTREAFDEFTYDLLSHEKEMKTCPKLEELILNLARAELESELPWRYEDIVKQTDRDHYLHAATSIEDVTNQLDTFLEEALAKIDFET